MKVCAEVRAGLVKVYKAWTKLVKVCGRYWSNLAWPRKTYTRLRDMKTGLWRCICNLIPEARIKLITTRQKREIVFPSTENSDETQKQDEDKLR